MPGTAPANPTWTIDLSAFCSVPLPLQVDVFAWSAKPIVQADLGRIGTSVQCDGEGYVSTADVAALAAAIAAIDAASQVSGADFTLTTFGQVVHRVLAANCIEGGPHVAFSVLADRASPTYRRVRFSVTARTNSNLTINTYALRTAVAPDGLRKATQTGVLQGADTAGLFGSLVLAPFLKTYPATAWVRAYESSFSYQVPGTPDNAATRYTLSAEELSDPLPAGGATGGKGTVVDGRATVSAERDEQHRLVTAYGFELTLSADFAVDPNGLQTQLRAAVMAAAGGAGGAVLTAESLSYASVRGRRLRSEFRTLAAADNNGLLGYAGQLVLTGADDVYETITYPGADPVAVRRPKVLPLLDQAGSAVGLGAFVIEPPPLWPDAAEQPVRRFSYDNPYECRTEWAYKSVRTDGKAVDVPTLLAGFARPATVSFYGAPGGGGSGGGTTAAGGTVAGGGGSSAGGGDDNGPVTVIGIGFTDPTGGA